MKEIIKKEITDLLCGIIGMDADISFNSDILLNDVGLDSIHFVEFIVALEEKYDIEVYDSDLILSNFSTLETVFATLEKYFQSDDDTQKLYKCVITDCDGVLWKGIAGEDGIDTPILDDHTITIQNTLKSLRQRGVYLCICSKNRRETITGMLNAESLLDMSDIAVSEFDAADKSDAIKRILDSLHISPEHAIFIDDSAYECGLIAAVFPEMTVLQADTADERFAQSLSALFDNLPEQSLDRTALYREQKEREKIRISAIDANDYNRQLQTKISCALASQEDASRIAELSQRTNHFNLSGRRYTEEQIERLIKESSYAVYALNATDIYGDMGLVAAAVVCRNTIENFMLSCRVFGRGFETVLIEKIKENCTDPLQGIFHETDKNHSHRQFYSEVGIEVIEE